MELKRLESEEYLTLGIGLRARKNKKLESWYFCVTDGRRVGKKICFCIKMWKIRLPARREN